MCFCFYAILQNSLLTSAPFADTNGGERQTGRKAQMSNISAAKT